MNVDATTLTTVAELAIKRLIRKSVRWYKLGMWGLLACMLILVITVGALTGLYQSVQKQSRDNCTTGNMYRANQIKVWDDYLSLQAKESKDTGAELAVLISVIAKGNKQEISEIYQALASSAKTDAVDQAAFTKSVGVTNAPRTC